VHGMEHHPDLAELAFLIGTWRGSGHGEYPTIDSFDYHEEASFLPMGPKPVMLYSQRTRDANTDEPLHTETGYLRPAGAGRLEMALAQPTGIVEIHTGAVGEAHIHLRSMLVGLTPNAVSVSDVERHIEVEGDTMRYRLAIAAVGHPLQPHLEATLVSVDHGPA
jgi:hypothetical protein